MSLEAMTWAFKQPLSGHAKVILLALADHANDDGECWPSMERIAAKSGVCERTAQRYMLALADEGYLSTLSRNAPDGRTMTKKIILHMGGEGDNESPQGDSTVTGEGDTVVTPYEPSEGTIRKNTKRGTRVPENFDPDSTAIRLSTDLNITLAEFQNELSRFLDYWRAVPGAKGLKLDWQGTFRNWLRTYAERRPRKFTNATTQGRHSIANSFDVIDAAIAEREAELDRLEAGAGIGGEGLKLVS